MKVVYNFAWFLWHLLMNRKMEGGPKVSKEIRNERLEKCLNCEKLDKTGFLAKLKGPRCKKCGCFVHYKVNYKFEECALEEPKWKQIL